MDNNREQNREWRTKYKLDHASQSGFPKGARRNYKRTAQRGRPQSVSGTSQGHCVIIVHLIGLRLMAMMDIGPLSMH